MKITIKDRKVLMDGKYYCDSVDTKLPNGKYSITFVHTNRFNSIMPVVNVPDRKDIMFCWCKEKCNRELAGEFCDAIQVGRFALSGELLQGRGTFNQLYDKMRHRKGKQGLVLEIN